jgi:hypothetical protein
MIRKLHPGAYRFYSRKVAPKTGGRRNLGTFKSRSAAEKHEREVQYSKRHKALEADMPTASRNVRFRGQSGKHCSDRVLLSLTRFGYWSSLRCGTIGRLKSLHGCGQCNRPERIATFLS